MKQFLFSYDFPIPDPVLIYAAVINEFQIDFLYISYLKTDTYTGDSLKMAGFKFKSYIIIILFI